VNEADLGPLVRVHHGAALATLIRILGDFDLAEDALQEAWVSALGAWRGQPPANPAGWLVTTARRKAIDRLRRDAAGRKKLEEAGRNMPMAYEFEQPAEDDILTDDRLRLIFTCCHPSLAMEARVALTLRTLGGLTTPEIARAFLADEPTVAQRIVRAKRKIRDAGIAYRVPEAHELPERLPGVLATLYLVFNEGYASTSSDEFVRGQLCTEAIRLTQVLSGLMPDEPEVLGLLALMLLHDSRRDARETESGDLILLEDQDRRLWDHDQIEVGIERVERALRMRRPGPYQLQAAIAAVHCEAATPEETRWDEIVVLYDHLLEFGDTPVIRLNRAVAVAFARSLEDGLAEMDAITGLDRFHLYHAARADLLRRLGRSAEARSAYERALEYVTNPAERRFLEGRLAENLKSKIRRA
jgi:RNA polymerase sigma-70 factor, ECF subfamily